MKLVVPNKLFLLYTLLEIVGSTEAQHEQKEIGLDNKEDYIDNFPAIDEHEYSVNHIDKGRASRSGPAGPGSSSASNSSAKIRVPRPYSAKEADRHRHQPHKSFREIERESAPHRHQASQISFAAKVMDFAQENPVMKSLDGISGGVLGAAMATFAAIANTAEAATTSLKENMSSSVDGELSVFLCFIERCIITSGTSANCTSSFMFHRTC